MERSAFWVVAISIAVVALPALALAGLERVRGLRETTRPDGTLRPARAVGSIQLAAGAVILGVAAFYALWFGMVGGLAIIAMGASSFAGNAGLGRRLEWVGLLLLLIASVLARTSFSR